MDYTGYGMCNQINIDVNRLQQLGFSQREIQQLQYVYGNGGKFTPSALQSYGYTYEQAKRLSYMYNICCGKVQINSKEEMIRHLKRVFGSNYKISIQDLAVSNVTDVPRLALVANIVDEPYNIWNSSNYKGKDMFYKVIDVSGQKITIETSKKPRLEWKQAKIVPGVLEIKGVRNNGNAVVVFDKKYCRLCNRFIIVASLRNPEFHHGKYEMVCFEGTKVYVYAVNMGTRENLKYKGGTQRVYAYGLLPSDIKPKLDNVTKYLYSYLHGVSVGYEDGNETYEVLTKDVQEQNYDDDIIM